MGTVERSLEERILGIPVDAVTPEEAVDLLVSWVEAGKRFVVDSMNPEKVIQAREDPRLLDFAERASLRIPDGIGLIWASKRQGGRLAQRVAGVDLFASLAAEAAGRGWPVYLLGGRPGVAEGAGEALRSRHPGLVLSGVHDGYFESDEAGEVARAIADSGARLLFVAMGSPRQEEFLSEHFEETGTSLAMGVGGSFDVLSGRVRRAPAIFQRLGLEWLFRFLLEPRKRFFRMGRLFRFALLVLTRGS